MTVDQKVLERIEKLLRLAGPSSKGSDHERASAALEAARLFDKHDVELTEPKPTGRASKVSAKSAVKDNAWVLSIALQPSGCSHCGNKISRGDAVWIRVTKDYSVEYRHNMRPCSVI